MKTYNQILRMSDSAEGNDVDPLAQAAGAVDTSFPLLAVDRTLKFECISCAKAPSKADPSRETLTLIVKTTQDTVFQDGKPARAGFKIFKRYGVTVTPPSEGSEGRTVEAIRKDLSFLLKSFFGGKTEISARDLLNNPSMLEGRMVGGKTNIEKGTGGFPDKSGVSFIIPAE